MLTFPMSYLAILYFVDLSLVLRVRAVTNHFPDPPIFAFEPVNMRNCGKRNFRKHREIKESDERFTYENMYEILKFSEKFDNLDKMETTSSE